MNSIDSLPPDFFEDVTLHKLDHRAGRYNITTDQYYVFGYQDQFRGIKKAYNDDSPPFYLLHKETFEVTRRVFENLFGYPPDQVKVYHDENKTWNAFIVGSSALTRYEQSAAFEPENTFAKAAPFVHFPLIGGINNYDLDKNPAFFYLIATPFQKDYGSVLTLDNFRFQKEEDKSLLFSTNRDYSLFALSDIIAKQFKKSEREFNDLLNSIQNQRINSWEFAPVVLDLYNKNRNPESILIDNTLRQRVRKLHMDAQKHLRRQHEVPWTEFIHFITRYNQFELYKGLQLESVEELFSKKEAFQKFDKAFRVFLEYPERFTSYVQSQVNDWQRIERFL